jgi:hypothetical protein
MKRNIKIREEKARVSLILHNKITIILKKIDLTYLQRDYI